MVVHATLEQAGVCTPENKFVFILTEFSADISWHCRRCLVDSNRKLRRFNRWYNCLSPQHSLEIQIPFIHGPINQITLEFDHVILQHHVHSELDNIQMWKTLHEMWNVHSHSLQRLQQVVRVTRKLRHQRVSRCYHRAATEPHPHQKERQWERRPTDFAADL